jgi:hypothetical protein
VSLPLVDEMHARGKLDGKTPFCRSAASSHPRRFQSQKPAPLRTGSSLEAAAQRRPVSGLARHLRSSQPRIRDELINAYCRPPPWSSVPAPSSRWLPSAPLPFSATHSSDLDWEEGGRRDWGRGERKRIGEIFTDLGFRLCCPSRARKRS